MVHFSAISALTIIVALALRPPANERPHLGREIAAAAATVGDGGRLDLAKVADFPWDRVHMFLAYSGKNEIYDGLGFEWLPVGPVEAVLFDGNLMLSSDELTLLVFVRGQREVTGWTILNREEFAEPTYVQFDFGEDGATVSSRHNASFVVKDVTGKLADPRYTGWLLSRD